LDPFADIAPPLTFDAAVAESHRCLFCFDAPCTQACPTHIDVPAFIKKIMTGNLTGSARVILDANPMGHSCARACPVDVLCEGACVMNDRDEKPIAIALLQRHATDYALEHDYQPFKPGRDTGRKVAIVGSGPAGLSCAQFLRRFGHAVTIFESKPQPGGLNTYGIAEYKLRPPTALAEAKMVLDLGVALQTGVTIGKDIPLDTLIRDYDAVFIAIGLGATKSLGIPGENLPGVVDAMRSHKPSGSAPRPPPSCTAAAKRTCRATSTSTNWRRRTPARSGSTARRSRFSATRASRASR